jgi:hypothetical protein
MRHALRRIAMGVAAAALVVVGLGAALPTRPRTLPDAWTALRRQTPAGAWTAIQRHASEAWITLRRQLPFDVPGQPPSHTANHDAAATRGGTHRRTPGKGNTVAKRGRDESRAGNTP